MARRWLDRQAMGRSNHLRAACGNLHTGGQLQSYYEKTRLFAVFRHYRHRIDAHRRISGLTKLGLRRRVSIRAVE